MNLSTFSQKPQKKAGISAASLLLLALLLDVSPVMAVVFVWRDATGVAHYTNREYEIPERYRAKAKALYPEQGDTAAQQLNISAFQTQPEVQPPAPVLLSKPEDQAVSSQPAITPKSKNIPGQAARKAQRNKEVAEE